jgi:hypothetical protein
MLLAGSGRRPPTTDHRPCNPPLPKGTTTHADTTRGRHAERLDLIVSSNCPLARLGFKWYSPALYTLTSDRYAALSFRAFEPCYAKVADDVRAGWRASQPKIGLQGMFWFTGKTR